MRRSPWKLTAYAVVIVCGILAVLPNFFAREQLAQLPSWIPKEQIVLGLDLRGGSQLLLEIDTQQVLQDRLASIADAADAALRGAKIGATAAKPGVGSVSLRVSAQEQLAGARRTLSVLASSLSTDGRPAVEVSTQDNTVTITPTQTDIAARHDRAADQSLEIVRRRIDEAGIAEPTVMRQGADRILVQLPGVQDPGRIKALLGSTARLTFHLVVDGAATAPSVGMVM